MFHMMRAILLGLAMAVALATVSRDISLPMNGVQIPLHTSLVKMKNGTADRPYVRRQLVPSLLRTVDHLAASRTRETANYWLGRKSFLRPLLWDHHTGGAIDSLVCDLVWWVSFSLFAYSFEAEALFYSNSDRFQPWQAIGWTVFTSLIVLALLHFYNFIYDPPTLALTTVSLVAVRRERIFHLTIFTALFTLNKETAFIVPGLVGLYRIYRKQADRALRQFALLSSIYVVISAALTLHYRHNPGSVTENHLGYLVWTYTHAKATFAVLCLTGIISYGVAVARFWKLLPPTLKAVQSFVPLWIALHVFWGWPMELRVMLEILPGMMLTIIYIVGGLRGSPIPSRSKDKAAFAYPA